MRLNHTTPNVFYMNILIIDTKSIIQEMFWFTSRISKNLVVLRIEFTLY